MLEEAGVHPVYVASPHETIEDFLRALRPGDEVWVATLARLAKTREGLRKVIRIIREKRCTIVEASTGRRYDDEAQRDDMFFDAVNELSGDARALSKKQAKEFGSRGGLAKKAQIDANRMPQAEAQKVWFDARFVTVGDALNAMPGWETRTAYRTFGPRRIFAGRPPKAGRMKDRPGDAPREPNHKIYFIQSGEGGPVKIGRSTHPENRMKELGTSHHTKLKLLAVMEGGPAEEKALHKRFKRQRINGEWFKFEGNFKRFVEKLVKDGKVSS